MASSPPTPSSSRFETPIETVTGLIPVEGQEAEFVEKLAFLCLDELAYLVKKNGLKSASAKTGIASDVLGQVNDVIARYKLTL